MRIVDRIAVTDMVMTGEGYLRVAAKLSRTGIQDYYGWEIGRQDKGEWDRVYRIYRDPAEVFSPDALASFGLKPITDGHPVASVTAETWAKEAKGIIADDVRRDGDHMAATLLLTDAEIINRTQRKGGTVELSCGYDCDLDMSAGVTDAGETYDGRQTNIRGNHVAIVDQGRCGSSCATSSGADTMPKLTDCPGNPRCQCQSTPANPDSTKGQDAMSNKTVTIDVKQLEVTADVAAVIEGLQAKVAHGDKVKDAAMQLAEIVERHTSVKAAEIAAKDAEIADLKGKLPTADQIAATATELASVMADAKSIAPDLDTKGQTADAIRLAAAKVAMGDKAAALDGKSADYVAATFDRLVDAAKSGSGSDPLRDGFKAGSGAKDAAPHKTYLDSLANAWKGA